VDKQKQQIAILKEKWKKHRRNILFLRDMIFGHKLHIGTPYRGKRFLTRQIPTSCLPKSGGIIGEH
jgi:hypothetical protein